MSEVDGTKVVKVCILGGGRAGAIHLQCLIEKPYYFKVTSVVDNFPSPPVKQIVGMYPSMSIRPTDECDDAISEADAVLIALPTYLHEQYIVKALELGKHVFCEKPIVDTLQGVERVYNLAEEKGLKLLCGMSHRHDAPAQRMKEEITSGNVGRIWKFSGVFRDNPCPPLEFLKTSPLMYADYGIHDIDFTIWFSQEKPTLVYCVSHCFNSEIGQLGGHDSAVITMKFPSGIIAIIDLYRMSTAGCDMSFTVHGEKKSLYSKAMSKDGYSESSEAGITSSSRCYSFREKYEDAFKAQMIHFYQCVIGDTLPIVTKSEVLAATLTTEAIHYSHQVGLPVIIDHDRGEYHKTTASPSAFPDGV